MSSISPEMYATLKHMAYSDEYRSPAEHAQLTEMRLNPQVDAQFKAFLYVRLEVNRERVKTMREEFERLEVEHLNKLQEERRTAAAVEQ